jgi:protease-4
VDAINIAGEAADMGEGPYRTQIFPRPKTFFERINSRFAAQATKMWQTMAATPIERTLWRHSRVLRRVTGTNGSVQARLPYELEIE